MGDTLSAKVNPYGVDKGISYEIRERKSKICVGQSGDTGVLVQIEKNGGNVEPKKSDWNRADKEENNRPVEGQGKQLWTLGAEGLGAEWLHSKGEPREH